MHPRSLRCSSVKYHKGIRPPRALQERRLATLGASPYLRTGPLSLLPYTNNSPFRQTYIIHEKSVALEKREYYDLLLNEATQPFLSEIQPVTNLLHSSGFQKMIMR
jgi:hypothetical protein